MPEVAELLTYDDQDFELDNIVLDTDGGFTSRESLIRKMANRVSSASTLEYYDPKSSYRFDSSKWNSPTSSINPNKEIEVGVPKYQILTPRARTFTPLQEWEGVVYSVDTEKQIFTARLSDLTNPQYVDEEADFPMEDVSDYDIGLIKPGALFRWALGYQRARTGTKMKVSQIVFRRLPQWKASDIEKNKRKAEKLSELLKGDTADST